MLHLYRCEVPLDDYFWPGGYAKLYWDSFTSFLELRYVRWEIERLSSDPFNKNQPHFTAV